MGKKYKICPMTNWVFTDLNACAECKYSIYIENGEKIFCCHKEGAREKSAREEPKQEPEKVDICPITKLHAERDICIGCEHVIFKNGWNVLCNWTNRNIKKICVDTKKPINLKECLNCKNVKLNRVEPNLMYAICCYFNKEYYVEIAKINKEEYEAIKETEKQICGEKKEQESPKEQKQNVCQITKLSIDNRLCIKCKSFYSIEKIGENEYHIVCQDNKAKIMKNGIVLNKEEYLNIWKKCEVYEKYGSTRIQCENCEVAEFINKHNGTYEIKCNHPNILFRANSYILTEEELNNARRNNCMKSILENQELCASNYPVGTRFLEKVKGSIQITERKIYEWSPDYKYFKSSADGNDWEELEQYLKEYEILTIIEKPDWKTDLKYPIKSGTYCPHCGKFMEGIYITAPWYPTVTFPSNGTIGYNAPNGSSWYIKSTAVCCPHCGKEIPGGYITHAY